MDDLKNDSMISLHSHKFVHMNKSSLPDDLNFQPCYMREQLMGNDGNVIKIHQYCHSVCQQFNTVVVNVQQDN